MQELDWDSVSAPATGQAAPRTTPRQGGGFIPAPGYENTERRANADDVRAERDQRLQEEKAERDRLKFEAEFNPDGTKKKPDNPDRAPQIKSLLRNIKSVRQMANETMAVGSWSGYFSENPLFNQNRKNIEGALEQLEGDMIQQQIAVLAEMNGGNGVATMANSETEARRMASSVANLSPDQSAEEFLKGLQRAEDFYLRQAARLEGVEPGDPSLLRKYLPRETAEGEGGDEYSDKRITDEDRELAARIQAAWDQGAGLEEIDAIAREGGRDPISSVPGIEKYLERRASGVPVEWQPSASGDRGALGQTADGLKGILGEDGSAFAVGAANALTAGTLDEIAGEGSQGVKDKLRDDAPLASFAGEVAGGTVAMLPVAKIAQGSTKAALAGDMAYGAAYGAGENNDNRLGGAAAGATGAYVGNKIGDKIVQRFNRKTPANAAEETVNEAAESIPDALTPAQKYERGQRYGIDMSIGDVRGRGSKIIERTLDNMPGGGTITGNARDKTRGQVNDALEDVASTYGDAGSAEATGESLQRAARGWIERAKGKKGDPLDGGVVGKAYDAIPIAPTSPAQVDSTVAALQEINGSFASNPKLAEIMRDSKAQRLFDALGDADDQISWSDLKALRSAIGEDMGPLRIGAQDSRQSTLSRLYGALSDDMRATAEAHGPKALAAFERANNLKRNVEQRIDQTLSTVLGRDGMQTPEAAATKLRGMITSGKSTSDINKLIDLRKSVPQGEWNNVASGLIRLAGQPAKSEGRDFQPAVFMRTFQDMTPKAKNLLFGKSGGELRKNLDEFTEVMGDIAASDGTRNTSNSGMVVAGALGLSGGLQTLATQTISSYGLARLWTHPPFVRWATGFAKMQRGAARNEAQPTAQNISKQIGLLDKLAKGQGPVSADILIFRDYLSKAANQSPERLAAEPTAAALPSANTPQSEETTTAQVPERPVRQ